MNIFCMNRFAENSNDSVLWRFHIQRCPKAFKAFSSLKDKRYKDRQRQYFDTQREIERWRDFEIDKRQRIGHGQSEAGL